MSLIDAELYRHIVTGNAAKFNVTITRKQVEVSELRYARDGNTALHIAAIFDQLHLVIEILSISPQLMTVPNSKGDLVIHSAMKTGKISTVKALISWTRESDQGFAEGILGWKNNQGNTVLHIAVENHELEIANELVDLYPPSLYVVNEGNVSPLYMAIRKEFTDLVKHMFTKLQLFKEDANKSLKNSKSLVHAVLALDNIEILVHLLKTGVELNTTVDENGRTPLSYVAYIGSLDKARLLLHAFPDISYMSDNDGSFPIHQAVLRGHLEMIDLLKDTMNLLNAKGQNILHLATQIDDPSMIYHILAMPNIDSLINQKDEDGNTPFHLATLAKNCVIIDILAQGKQIKDNAQKSSHIDAKLYSLLVSGNNVDQVCKLIRVKGYHLKDLRCPKDNSTALHIAATMGDRFMVDKLLTSGCAELVTLANDKGDLPIHLAARAGKFEVVKALVSIGSEEIYKISDRDGNTVLHLALIYNHEEIAEYLFDQCPQAIICLNKEKICPLYLAIARSTKGMKPLLTKMIDELNDSNVRRLLKDAKSIMHVAVIKGYEAGTMETLVDKFPTLLSSSFDRSGRSPLSYAAHTGCVEQVKFLLEKFPHLAFMRDRDEDGSFPIHQASRGGQKKVIKLLFYTRKLLNIEGQNILHVAAKTGRSDLVKYLLKIGECRKLINEPDIKGNTALHLAVKGLQAKVAYILSREKSIDPNSVNNDLWTPLDLFHMNTRISSGKDSELELSIDKVVISTILIGVKGMRSPFREFRERRNVKKSNAKDWSMEAQSSTKALLKTNLMVSTIIMTIIFAAALAPPGGYIQVDASNAESVLNHNSSSFYVAGMATLSMDSDFRIFQICNGISFLFALVSALCTMSGLYGEPQCVKLASKISSVVLPMGIWFMSFAFLSAINAAWVGIPRKMVLCVGLFLFFTYLWMNFFKPQIENPRSIQLMFLPFKLFLSLCRNEEPLDFAI